MPDEWITEVERAREGVYVVDVTALRPTVGSDSLLAVERARVRALVAHGVVDSVFEWWDKSRGDRPALKRITNAELIGEVDSGYAVSTYRYEVEVNK
jgi:hypothetical protein